MKSVWRRIRDPLMVAGILCTAFVLSLLCQGFFKTQALIPAIFVFAVFLISLWTRRYLYGMLAAVASTVAVNYAFTFPYFKLNFTIPENFVSALLMVAVALLTGALTTKIKRQEVLRAENEKEHMRANLLRAISHDLRTPLTTIYGASSTLLENYQGLTEIQQFQLLRGIQDDAQWLIRMVENLLSVTRIDSGKVKLLKTPTVLDELIDAALVKFRKRYPRQEVALELPEDVVVIPMDALLIEQVLINLLENAVQHAAGMTTLRLRVFTLEHTAIFEIADNGCGIPGERLKQIFSGELPGDDVPADGQKRNAGIGLSVCASIIKAHGGSIAAGNAQGGGAVVRFSLTTEETAYE